ncbi:MAG: hypothetical protein ACI81L_002285 [Verrucomicrobiales bacterium]|jgi:hypothetical protein
MRPDATAILTGLGVVAIAVLLVLIGLSGRGSPAPDQLLDTGTPIQTVPTTSPSVVPDETPPTDQPTTAPPQTVVEAVPVRTSDLYVSVSGIDREEGGWTPADPLASPSYAISLALPGDTINILPGTYDRIVIDGKQQLTIRAPERGVTLTSGMYERFAGVLVENSSDIVVEGLAVTKSLWGIRVLASTRISIQYNSVFDIGQEGIHVLGRSTDVTIEGNRVDLTGQREGNNGVLEFADLGEGIYLGTGGRLADGTFDDVSNIRVIGNEISNTSAEAIEIKASVFDVVVRDNLVHDIDVHSGAAVSIGRGTRSYDANVIVENNAIWNVTTRNQWKDGIGIRVSSPATVTANVIWNVEHYGIKIDTELRSVDGAVDIRNNLIFDAGIEAFVNDATGNGVPINAEGTIEDDDAEELLGQLNQIRSRISPQPLIDYLNGL